MPPLPHPKLWGHSFLEDRPSHSPPAIPLNLNLAGALAWQHQEGHLHLGLIGMQWEVDLGEHLGGGANALLVQALLEVLRKFKGSDCGWRRGRSCRNSGWGSPKHEAYTLLWDMVCMLAYGQAAVGEARHGARHPRECKPKG